MNSLNPRAATSATMWGRLCAHLVEPSAERPRQFELWLLFVAGLALGAAVRSQFWHTGFGWDDRYAQCYLGFTATGRMSGVEFAVMPWQVHWAPLWFWMYYCLWQLFGTSAWAYHALIEVWHAGAAPALFGLGLFFWRRRLPALLGALFWSAVPTSHADGPLLCVANGAYAATVTPFLWTMFALTRLSEERSKASWSARLWLIVAFAMWGASITWTPVLLAQHFLSRGVGSYSVPASRALHLPWVTPTVLYALFLVPLTLVMSPNWFPETIPLGEVVVRMMAQLANALGRIIGPAQPNLSGIALLWQGALGTVVLMVACRRSPARRLVALFLIWSLIYLGLASYRRATDISWEENLRQGRMLYIAELFWCVCLGGAIGAWNGGLSRRPVWLCGACLAIVVLFTAHQHRAARSALEEFSAYWAEADAKLRKSQELLAAVAIDDDLRAGAAMADFPIHIPPLYHSYYPLSAFQAVHGDPSSEPLHFAPVASFTDAEIAGMQTTLLNCDQDLAVEWEGNLVQVYNDVRALIWLDGFVQRESVPGQIPDLERLYGGVQLRLSEIAQFGMADPLQRLELVPVHRWVPGTASQLVLRLRQSNDPQAARWLEAMRNIE